VTARGRVVDHLKQARTSDGTHHPISLIARERERKRERERERERQRERERCTTSQPRGVVMLGNPRIL